MCIHLRLDIIIVISITQCVIAVKPANTITISADNIWNIVDSWNCRKRANDHCSSCSSAAWIATVTQPPNPNLSVQSRVIKLMIYEFCKFQLNWIGYIWFFTIDPYLLKMTIKSWFIYGPQNHIWCVPSWTTCC